MNSDNNAIKQNSPSTPVRVGHHARRLAAYVCPDLVARACASAAAAFVSPPGPRTPVAHWRAMLLGSPETPAAAPPSPVEEDEPADVPADVPAGEANALTPRRLVYPNPSPAGAAHSMWSDSGMSDAARRALDAAFNAVAFDAAASCI
jgi:hypothetical protein